MDKADEKYIEWIQNEVEELGKQIDRLGMTMPALQDKIRADVEYEMEHIGQQLGLSGTHVKFIYAFYLYQRMEKIKKLTDELPPMLLSPSQKKILSEKSEKPGD